MLPLAGLAGGAKLDLKMSGEAKSEATGRLDSQQTGGAGFTGSIFNNIATGRSSLTASATASQGEMQWIWIAAIGAAAVLLWLVWKK